MSEGKTALPSVRNQELNKVKTVIEKANKVLQHIPKDNITELNELIFAGTKVESNKIGLHLRNLNRNTKPGWEMNLEGEIKYLWQQVKLPRNLTEKRTQKTTLEKPDNKTGRNK